MRLAILWIILQKELIETLRDRKIAVTCEFWPATTGSTERRAPRFTIPRPVVTGAREWRQRPGHRTRWVRACLPYR